MSALGQKQTWRQKFVTSALPPENGHSLVRANCPLSAGRVHGASAEIRLQSFAGEV